MEPCRRVGIVGGGQLAVMMAEAARRLGLEVEALARSGDDPVFRVVPSARVGDACSFDDLRSLAEGTDVITFDHELVDRSVLARLEADGFELRPGSTALAVATDKRCEAGLFEALALDRPDTVIVHEPSAALDAVARFGGAAVLKTATGGYDGRGVLLDVSEHAVRSWFPENAEAVLVQRRVPIDCELAVQVVRGVDGEIVAYPPVRTVQVDGMCSVVHVPSGLGDSVESRAIEISKSIADSIDAVGVLAVEFFVTDGRVVVNEIAARPHNSGHLTIEATLASQFDNHMRAVAGMPLGSTELVVPAAAMVNVVGPSNSIEALGPMPTDVAVHMYGKSLRPGRKIGHVTAIAPTIDEAVERASRAAEVLEAGRVSA